MAVMAKFSHIVVVVVTIVVDIVVIYILQAWTEGKFQISVYYVGKE